MLKLCFLKKHCCYTFLSCLLFVFALLNFIIQLKNENKNFIVTIISNQISENRWESDRRKYKASPIDKKLIPYVNAQFQSKLCLFLDMFYPIFRILENAIFLIFFENITLGQCQTQTFFGHAVGNIFSDTQSPPNVGSEGQEKIWNCALLEYWKMHFPFEHLPLKWIS